MGTIGSTAELTRGGRVIAVLHRVSVNDAPRRATILDTNAGAVRLWLIAVVAAGAAAVVLLVALGLGIVQSSRSMPEFPSLLDQPDPSVHGTVAYHDPASDCIRIVAAGGGPSREVFCIPPLDVADAEAKGKPLGPQLVWLDDGLLEVTMFRMTDPPGPGFRPGWQKIVDVRTGAVVDLPDADAPAAANLATRPTVSPTGRELTYTSDAQSGRVTITLTEPDGGRRVLLDTTGPGNYTYGLDSVFWSPDFEWIAADDGRILVITAGDTPLVRELVNIRGVAFGGDDPRLSGFAVTAEDLLPASG